MRKLFPFLFAVTALGLVASFLVMTGRDGQDAAADAPHAGLSFAIGLDVNDDGVDDCDTNPATIIGETCPANTGSPVVASLYLTGNGSLAYEGFDSVWQFTGVTANATQTYSWPSCAFQATFYGVGIAGIGCAKGIGAADSTYTGELVELDFTCTASGTIAIAHGPGNTGLTAQGAFHGEAASGTEGLSIVCPGGAPTSTATQTATATRTNTPSPTITNTPVATATATASVTATPSLTPVTPAATSTSTATATATNTSTATSTPTNTATATSTSTNTATPTLTTTPVATSTAANTATATATDVATSTATSTATRTNTPAATSTATRTATPPTSPTATPTPGTEICADLTGDDLVSVRDLLKLIFALHRDNESAEFDINGDGDVNTRDLVALVHQFGERCDGTEDDHPGVGPGQGNGNGNGNKENGNRRR